MKGKDNDKVSSFLTRARHKDAKWRMKNQNLKIFFFLSFKTTFEGVIKSRTLNEGQEKEIPSLIYLVILLYFPGNFRGLLVIITDQIILFPLLTSIYFLVIAGLGCH